MSKTQPQSPFLKALYEMPCTICERRPCQPHQITATPPGFPPFPGNFAPLCKAHLSEAATLSTQALVGRYRQFYLWLVQHRRDDVLKSCDREIKEAGWTKNGY